MIARLSFGLCSVRKNLRIKTTFLNLPLKNATKIERENYLVFSPWVGILSSIDFSDFAAYIKYQLYKFTNGAYRDRAMAKNLRKGVCDDTDDCHFESLKHISFYIFEKQKLERKILKQNRIQNTDVAPEPTVQCEYPVPVTGKDNCCTFLLLFSYLYILTNLTSEIIFFLTSFSKFGKICYFTFIKRDRQA
jgi:hypothetical protein